MEKIIEKYNLKLIDRFFYNTISSTYVFSFNENTIILIDMIEFDLKQDVFSYSLYCEMQNRHMHKSKTLFRFIYNERLDEKIQYFLNIDSEDITIDDKGGHFDKIHIDNSPLEHLFEEIFAQTYGNHTLSCLKKEVAFSSSKSKVFFADYVLETRNNKYIFEENGASYHHPLAISQKSYKTQLEKQNMFSALGYKTYRFSTENLNFKEQISENLKLYLEPSENFLKNSIFKNERKVVLYQHQEKILESLDENRKKANSTSLIILPTGTGKSQIVLSDLQKNYIKNDVNKVLVLVPSRAIRNDWIQRLNNFDYEIDVSVYNSIFKIKNTLKRSHYDYIVVDEAHHAQAANLKATIQYFKPKYLIGLTATPERTDAKKLEEIFNEYEVDLSLEEAIKENILVDIAPFRLKSNIDLQDVRFNGKDYNYSDLEKTLIVDSRNNLIVECVKEYFSNLQGIIFCVNINHAKKLAKLLNDAGIKTGALYGNNKDNESIFNKYKSKEINFLTTCNMISEGWDCPQTEVIVMARPTLSKVLYYQQLGRGLRKYENKKCLWLVDVVDNYSAKLQPWTFNSLFKMENYIPFNGIKSNYFDFLNIEGLNEFILKMEKIDIFTLEEQLKNHLSLEQAARELYIGTDTLRKWDRDSKYASERILIGNKLTPYFSNDDIVKIRLEKKLKVHSDETLYSDFIEFIETNTLSFSYKLVFLISCIKLANKHGEINLSSLVEEYKNFYKLRIENHLPVDKKGCPYDIYYLDNFTKIKNNMLSNPFEKFERKRFLYISKDLNVIVFNPILWDKLTFDSLSKIEKKLKQNLKQYYKNLGGLL